MPVGKEKRPYKFKKPTSACAHALIHGIVVTLMSAQNIEAGSHVTQSGHQDEAAKVLLADLD